MAVFGHQHVQLLRGVGVPVPRTLVILGPQQEDHPVGVLLNGPRIPQVRQLWPVVLAGLALPVQLGQGEHGHPEPPGHGLDGPGYLRGVVIPAAQPPPLPGGHLAQIVNDDEGQPRDLPGQGLHLRHGGAGLLIDVQGQLVQHVGGLGHFGVFRIRQALHQQLVSRHAALPGGALGLQLLHVHLQGDKQHRPCPLGHPVRDVHGQGGLAHARAGGQDIHAACQHPAPQHVVQVPVARGHKALSLPPVHRLPVPVEAEHSLLGADELPLCPLLFQLLQGPGRLLQDVLGPGLLVQPLQTAARQVPNAPGHGVLPGQPGVFLHIGRRGGGVHQLHDVLVGHGPAHAPDLLAQQHRVGGLSRPGQGQGRLEQLPVGLQAKVPRAQDAGGHRQALRGDQDGPDHGVLRLKWSERRQRPPPPPRR